MFNVTDIQFKLREDEARSATVMNLDEKELEGIAEVRHQRRRHKLSLLLWGSSSTSISTHTSSLNINSNDSGATLALTTVVIGRAQLFMGAMRDFIG